MKLDHDYAKEDPVAQDDLFADDASMETIILNESFGDDLGLSNFEDPQNEDNIYENANNFGKNCNRTVHLLTVLLMAKIRRERKNI